MRATNKEMGLKGLQHEISDLWVLPELIAPSPKFHPIKIVEFRSNLDELFANFDSLSLYHPQNC